MMAIIVAAIIVAAALVLRPQQVNLTIKLDADELERVLDRLLRSHDDARFGEERRPNLVDGLFDIGAGLHRLGGIIGERTRSPA
jgi:hypothetical protein